MIEKKEHFTEKWEEKIKGEDILKKVTAKILIGIFKDSEIIEEFNVDLYFKTVEKIMVCDCEMLIVSLLDGTEIEVK